MRACDLYFYIINNWKLMYGFEQLCKPIHYVTFRISNQGSLIHYLGKLFAMLDDFLK